AWALAKPLSSIGGRPPEELHGDSGTGAAGILDAGGAAACASAAGGVGDGFAAVASGLVASDLAGVASSSASMTTIRSPWDTRPPCATFTSSTVPALGDGTSIAA